MFGEQNRSAKQTVMKAILNTKMVEGSLVRDHVLKMMGLLNELEVLGAVIDKEFQVEMLQAAESNIKQQAPVMEANIDKTSVSKPRGDKKKKKDHKVLAPGGAVVGVKNPKGKCYHCKEPQHHKKAIPCLSVKVE
uniref:Gag/pol protein n=1 Tax=Nicotiana tabacum TaxID=4097 RepID=A0A1S4AWA0_TOBAC|nr:PREDICTED: uncharacterized protein LOC107801904 [Nicotiana tabacum]